MEGTRFVELLLPLLLNHIAPLCPGFETVGKFFDLFRMFGGEVIEFGAVGFHVVEFPWASGFRHEFVLAVSDGFAFVVFKEEGSLAVEGLTLEGGL